MRVHAPPTPARPAAIDREACVGRKADTLLAALAGPTVAPPETHPVPARLHPSVPAVAALGARAVTLGSDIAFAPGHYRPEAPEGRALLAHEATHVAQQAKGGTASRASTEAAADRAASGHAPPALGAPLAPAFSLQEYQQSRSDLDALIAALTVSELRSDIAEINEYLDRQTTSNDDTAHLNEVKAKLEARLVGLLRAANAPAPAPAKPGKKQKGKKAPAAKAEPEGPVGPLAIPRILSEGTSRQLTDPDEINREVDVIVAWLQQKDVPKRERQILQAELGFLSPDFEANQAQKSQARQTARLAAAFANPTEDAAGLRAQLAIVEGIGTDPAEPGMAFIYHEGERLRITVQQAAELRAKSKSALKTAVASARNKAVEAEGLYAAMAQVNDEHPVVSRIAQFLGGVDDPMFAMSMAKAVMQVSANQADAMLAQDRLSDASGFVVQASSHARRMYMAAYAWREGQIAGAETAVAGLTFVRDASFAIAIAIGAVVAAPVVAGAVATAGITGTGATVLTIAGTGTVVGTGAAGVGGGADYAGQRLAGADHGTAMKSAKEEGWRRFKEGAAAGAGGGTTRVISTGLGQASTKGGQLAYDVLAQGGGSAVGGMSGAALEGKSADEVLLEGGRQGLLGTVAPVAGAPFSKPGTKLLVGAAASTGANFLDAKARGATDEEAFRGAAIGIATTGVLHFAPQPKPGTGQKPDSKPPPDTDTPGPKAATPGADSAPPKPPAPDSDPGLPKVPVPDAAEQTMAGTAKPSTPAPDSDPFPARIAPGQDAHDAWVNTTLEKGLKTRPPPLPKPNAPPPKVGETHYGLKSMDEAIAVYDDFRARAKGREVGIYRDSKTGEYAVIAGKEGSVGKPAKETGGTWDNVVHNHPNPTGALTFRNPAPQDILGPGPSGFALEAIRAKRPVTTFIDSDIPGGGRRFTAVTSHPDGRVDIRYLGQDGKPVSKSFANLDDFRADWSSRKVFVDKPDPDTSPPPGQGKTTYDDMIRDIDEWLRVRRNETGDPFEPQQTMAGTAKPGAQKPSTPPASAKPENDFSDVGAAVGTQPPGAVKPQGPSRNRFPDFAPVTPAEQPKVNQQVAALSTALGEPMPANRALAAPWVGRPRNKAGEPMASGTSEGWLRSDYRYWKAFAQAFPADYALIGPGRTVTPQLAARWGWSAKTIGQKLTHHHIDNGSIVLPVPEGLHQGQSGDIHAKVKVEGTP